MALSQYSYLVIQTWVLLISLLFPYSPICYSRNKNSIHLLHFHPLISSVMSYLFILHMAISIMPQSIPSTENPTFKQQLVLCIVLISARSCLFILHVQHSKHLILIRPSVDRSSEPKLSLQRVYLGYFLNRIPPHDEGVSHCLA